MDWIAELAVGNIVRRVLHIIREEDVSLTAAATGGLNISAESDEDDDVDRDDYPVLSAAVVAAAARSTLRPPSLQTLLEDVPNPAAVPHSSSSGGDSEGKSKCKFMLFLLEIRSSRIGKQRRPFLKIWNCKVIQAGYFTELLS